MDAMKQKKLPEGIPVRRDPRYTTRAPGPAARFRVAPPAPVTPMENTIVMRAKPAVREADPEIVSDDFKLEDFLPHRLAVAAARVNRLMSHRFEEASGVSIPEWRVLAVIGRFGVLSPSAVGDRTTMDKVKVSRAAASLVARGLLKQSQDPTDGRGRLLRLTRKGATACQNLMPLAHGIEEELARGLGRAEWTALQKALVRLDQHVIGIEDPDAAEAAD